MRGGKRPGAGRKPSGKRRIVMYGTAAEEKILRETLLKQRESLSVMDSQEAVETICRPKICPACSKPMVVRSSKASGDFWGCSGYPSCRHTESI